MHPEVTEIRTTMMSNRTIISESSEVTIKFTDSRRTFWISPAARLADPCGTVGYSQRGPVRSELAGLL
jgi:hypothetical protein